MGWVRKRRRPARYDRSAPAANVAPALDRLAAELVDEDSAISKAMDAQRAAQDLAEDQYAARLQGMDPDAARETVFAETVDHQLANRVRHRVWVDSWKNLADDEFVRLADGALASWNPRRVDFSDVMVALDIERERRGLDLPPPLIDLSRATNGTAADWTDPRTRSGLADSLFWELNHRLASFDASEAEIVDCKRAEAEGNRAWRLTTPTDWDHYGRRRRADAGTPSPSSTEP